MIPVARAATIRAIEQRYASELGLPLLGLMELASRAVAEHVRSHFHSEAARGVTVVCGAGQNGGDGYGCARWLASWGYPVRVWSLEPASRGDAAVMRAAARAAGVSEIDAVASAGLFVDALFGTGLSRPIVGRAANAIAAMNASGLPVVAVDVPSGIDSDCGAVHGVAVKAAHTVTFGAWKPGLLAGAGPDHAGTVSFADIGLGAYGSQRDAEIPESTDLAALWPRRTRGGHKNRSGHLVLIAGSRAMAGAAILAALGASAAGVGLLTVVVPEGAIPRLAGLPPEAMLRIGAGLDRLEALPPGSLDGATAVAAGPGLGGGLGLPPVTEHALRALWHSSPLPVAFDADALAVVAASASSAPRVVTPHPGEAGRMLGSDAAAVEADRFVAVTRIVPGATTLLKGRNSLIASPGRPVSVNPRNSPLLATGGSGDVLLGVVGALLARGVAAHDAARCAAWVHGAAAEALEATGRLSVPASAIAAEIPAAVQRLLGGSDAASTL